MPFTKLWKISNTKAVSLASEHLGVSEYELFAIAYRGWHKCEPNPQELQKIFSVFNTKGTIPRWLRHYLSQLDARTHFKSANRPALLQTHRRAELFQLITLMFLLQAFSFNLRLAANKEHILSC